MALRYFRVLTSPLTIVRIAPARILKESLTQDDPDLFLWEGSQLLNHLFSTYPLEAPFLCSGPCVYPVPSRPPTLLDTLYLLFSHLFSVFLLFSIFKICWCGSLSPTHSKPRPPPLPSFQISLCERYSRRLFPRYSPPSQKFPGFLRSSLAL